jgi:uncharacterized protein YlaN (UPF0358 family)
LCENTSRGPLNESFNKLKKDAETGLTNVQKAVESGLERVEGTLNAHIARTTKQIYGISQEVNFRIRTMMADLVDHKNQTEAYVNAVRQELLYVKKKLNWETIREVRNVSNRVAKCENQIES